MREDLSIYFSGMKIYGGNLSIEEIEEWFKDEQYGYAYLGSKDKTKYRYKYHELNRYHGYKHLKDIRIKNALAFGGAYGDEVIPIIGQIENLTILEPSEAFSGTEEIQETPCNYVKPGTNGDIPFADNTFDLITTLGVLHHIPNVTHVMKELYRCLDKGGIMLVREPIVSMGDWTKPRPGLTKRERGIPIKIFHEIISKTGFEVKYESLCVFRAIPKLLNNFGISAYNSRIATKVDQILSTVF